MAKCPYRFGLPKKDQECIKNDCEMYTHLTGMNPQTGQPMDSFRCAISFIPILLVENSQQQRQTAASVDKVANQIYRQRSEFIGALPEEAKTRIVKSDVKALE